MPQSDHVLELEIADGNIQYTMQTTLDSILQTSFSMNYQMIGSFAINDTKTPIPLTKTDNTISNELCLYELILSYTRADSARTIKPTVLPRQIPDIVNLTYYIHDHLGNTRVTYDKTGCSNRYNLHGVFDYYPYGKILRECQPNQTEKYLTTHHQRDEETTLDYRYARFYDSDLGRFLSIDPMAADNASWSGYNYVVGNPVVLIDPTGNFGEYYNQSGFHLGTDGLNDDKTYLVNSVENKTLSSDQLTYLKDKEHSGSTDPLVILLPIEHSKFKDIAGTIYAEGTAGNLSFEEAAGIYSVMRNRAEASNKSVHDIAKGGGIYGWKKRTKIDNQFAGKSSRQNAYKGTIEGIIGNKDYSGGGFYWHGTDFSGPTKGSRAHEDFYKVGFTFTNSNHDIWKLGNKKSGNKKWDYKYQSTGVGGKTTFIKLTNQWVKSEKYRNKW